MEKLKINCESQLDEITAISVTHSALRLPIRVECVSEVNLYGVLENQLSDQAKLIFKRFVNTARRKKGFHLASEDRKTIERACVSFSSQSATMELRTAQELILPILPILKSMLPVKGNRNFKKQKSKIDYLEAISGLNMLALGAEISCLAVHLEFESLTGIEDGSICC